MESYVAWIGPPRTHAELFRDAVAGADGDSRRAFATLYRSMGGVISFGRTAKFDYLTMIGKLGLAPIEPGSIFTGGATGPLRGARLLFLGSASARGHAQAARRMAGAAGGAAGCGDAGAGGLALQLAEEPGRLPPIPRLKRPISPRPRCIAA